MNLSLNELEGLARKAARGAGLPWGLAEESGKAARWLAAAGWPGAEALAAHLSAIDSMSSPRRVSPCNVEGGTGMWDAPIGAMCPLTTGALVSDLAPDWENNGTLRLGRTAYPLLVVPYLVWGADRTGATLSLNWPGVTITRGRGETGFRRGSDAALNPEQVDWVQLDSADAVTGTSLARSYRAELSAQTFETLTKLAQRTYAPETEERRLSGAGAGLIDND